MGETRIREALELLRERGWHRGNFAADLERRDGWTRMCAAGSIRCAWTGNPFESMSYSDEDESALAAVITEHFPTIDEELWGEHTTVIAEFNDNYRTTFADIELVMEKAAIMREEAIE